MALIEENPEAFKLKRSFIEPVNPGDFMTLFASIGRARANSWNPGIDYMDPVTGRTSSGQASAGNRNDAYVEVERWATARTSKGQLVGIRLFGEGNPLFADAGIVAMTGIAPTAPESIKDEFVLSREGGNHWITDRDGDRSITTEELYDLVGQLDALEISDQRTKPE